MATIRAIQEEDAQQAGRAQAGAALVQTFHNGPSRMDQVRSDKTTVSASTGGKIWLCMHGCGKVCEEKSTDPDRCSCRARLSGISGVIKKAAGMLQSKKRSCCLCKLYRVHAHTHARTLECTHHRTYTHAKMQASVHARSRKHAHACAHPRIVSGIHFFPGLASTGWEGFDKHACPQCKTIRERALENEKDRERWAEANANASSPQAPMLRSHPVALYTTNL